MKKLSQIFRSDKLFALIISFEILIIAYLFLKAVTGGAMAADFFGETFFDNVRSFETIDEDGTDLLIRRMPAEQQADLEHGINIYSEKFALSSGAYIMTVDYESEGGEQMKYLLTSNGYLGIRSVMKEGTPKYESLYLDDFHGQVSGRLYIPAFSSVNDLQLFIHYDGPGTLRIKSISIRERRVYRFMQLLGFLFCYAVFDVIYYFLFSPLYSRSRLDIFSNEKQRTIAMGIATIVFASIPLFTGYIYEGHDTMFHLNRIEAIAAAMRYHKLPVRIQSDMLLGFGYSTPLYYCDIFLYPSAFLYEYCMIPLRVCYQLYIFIMNVLTAYLSYRCFRIMFNDRDLAICGMAMYTLSEYRLVDIFLREAAGEYTALTFLPLVLEGMYRIYTREKIKTKDWLPLAIGMTCLVQSHLVSAIIVGFFLVIFMIMKIRKLAFGIVWAIAKAAASALLLSAWFVLPMLESMISQKPVVTEISNRIQWTGIYLSQLLEILPRGTGISREGTYADMPLGIGGGLLAALVFLIIYVLRRNIDKGREIDSLNSKVLNVSFVLGLLALWMSTVYFPRDIVSRILIGRLDSLRSVWETMEVVWRQMMVATLMLVTAFMALLFIIRKEKPGFFKPMLIIAVSMMLISDLSFYQGVTTDREQGTYIQMDNDRQAYMDMSADYDLVWGMTRNIMDTSIITEGTDITVESYDKVGADRVMKLSNKGDEGEAILPLFDFDNYHAYDIGTGEEFATRRSDVSARLAVMIPSGYQGTVRVTYRPPAYWHVAELISLIAWLILAAYGLIMKIKTKRA